MASNIAYSPSEAVVNFTSSQACQSCFTVLKQALGLSNLLISDLKQAEHQGLAENLALFITKAGAFDPQHKPHVFSGGMEIPLSLACAKYLPHELLLKPAKAAQPRAKENVLKFDFPPGLKHRPQATPRKSNRLQADTGLELVNCAHVGILVGKIRGSAGKQAPPAQHHTVHGSQYSCLNMLLLVYCLNSGAQGEDGMMVFSL